MKFFNKKKFSSSQKGFTLVELMAVMAIISIMSALMITSLTSSRNTKFTEGEARKLAANLREAQNNALAGKKIHATNPSCSFAVLGVLSGDTSYSLGYNHRTGTSCATGMTYVDLRTVLLENGVSFSSDSPRFRFDVPRGLLYNEDLAAYATAPLQMVLSKNGSSGWSVCIYPGGKIEEKSPGNSC